MPDRPLAPPVSTGHTQSVNAAPPPAVVRGIPQVEPAHLLAAIGFALGGFGLLSAGDAVAKTLSGQWPGLAVAALRYVFGVLLLSAMVAASRGRGGFVFPRPWLQWVRGAAVGLATFGFFMGVQVMPLPTATSILFVGPAITAILSAVILKERAPASTWIAVILAFAGVLVILRPEVSRLGWAAGYPLLSAIGMSVLMLANRAVAGSAPPLVLQWTMAVVAAVLLLLASGFGAASGLSLFAVPLPDAAIVLKCAVIGLTGTGGHWLLYLSATRAPATVTAPIVYSQLIFATLIGWLVFGNVPDVFVYLGAALIIMAGLILWRGQLKRAREPLAAAESP